MILSYFDDLKQVQAVINNFSSFDDTGIKTALSGLSKEQLTLLASSKMLSEEQKQQVASQLALIGTTNQLTAAQVAKRLENSLGSAEDAKQLLLSAGLVTADEFEKNATIELTAAKLNEAIANGTLSASDAGVIAGALGITGANAGATVSFKLLTASIWANIKALGSWLVTNPVGWITLATGAILGLSIAYNALIPSFDETREKMDEASSSYQETTSELESLRSELETTEDRIKELKAIQANGKLSFVEEEELSRLEQQNEKLSKQLEIKEKLANLKAKEQAEAAKEVLDYKSEQVYQYNDDGTLKTDKDGNAVTKNVDRFDYLDEQMRLYEQARNNAEKAQDALNKVEKNYVDGTIDKKTYDKTRSKFKASLESNKKAVSKYEKEISSTLDDLDGDISQLYDVNGNIIEGFEGYVERYNSISDAFHNIDLSPTQKELKKIEDFFDGSSSKNRLRTELIEIAKSENGLNDVAGAFHRLGINFEDTGINAQRLTEYINNLADATKEAAKEADTYSVDGSYNSVVSALESENQDSKWSKMAEGRTTVKDLVKNKKWGTDDFQTYVQFLSPEKIEVKDGELKASKYLEAWEKYKGKAERYFNSEKQLQSAQYAQNDLISAGLGKRKDGIIDWSNLESSAQAAEALGVSLEAAEVILRNLEAHGHEFSETFFAGEHFDEYKGYVENLQSIYDTMEDGADKDRLKLLLGGEDGESGWNAQVEKYEKDLSELTEDQVIHLRFEYNLATIQQEIDALNNERKNNGGRFKAENAEKNGEITLANATYLSQAKEGLGLNVDKVTVPAEIKASEDSIEKLYSDLDKAEYGSDKYLEIQAKIENQQELQKELYQIFSEENPEINAESNAEEIQKAWEDFFDEPHHLNVDTELTKDDLESQLARLEEGSTITFYAETDDGSFQTVEAKKDEEGKITYYSVLDDGSKKEVELNTNTTGVLSLTVQDNTQQGVSEANASLDSVEDPEATISVDNVLALFRINNTKEKLEELDGKKSHTYIYTHNVTDGKGNKAEGTVHVSGTAHALGINNDIPDDALTNSSYRTTGDDIALTGELGREIVVHGDKWWTVGEDGAEFAHIPSDSIVFNHKQTEELLGKGKTKSRGKVHAMGTAFLEGNAYVNAGLDLGGNSGNKTNKSNNKNKSKNKTKDTKDDFEELFDWIERRIKDIEREIDNLGQTASASYKSWEDRNKAITDQIALVNKEISVQESAYERYMKQANKVGLSDKYKKLVEEGKIDISKIKDKDLAEKIKEYQEWYDKAIECKDATQDLQDELAELARQKFDNVVTQFENILSTIEHTIDMLEGSIDKIEAEGYLVSSKIYENIKKEQEENLSVLEQERDALTSALETAVKEGNIEIYSEEWYAMIADIQDVDKEIQNLNIDIAETNRLIRETEWAIFDKMQEMLGTVQSESDFLIDLMSNDKMYDEDTGAITEQGQATLGLHAVNFNSYMSQADDYAKEIEDIDIQLQNDPYNVDLLERRQELIEAQRDAILAAEDEKQAMKDLVAEGYDAFLNVMDKAIEKRKEMLQATKDMYDYEKNIAAQTKEIANLEKQLQAYSGDTSEAAKATVQQLKVSLEEAKQNLEETEYDKYISDQEQMLDTIRDETEQWINERLDNIDLLIQGVIDSTNANAGEIKTTLEKEVDAVGITLSDAMTAIWSTDGEAAKVVTTYGEGFNSAVTTTNTILTDIRNYLKAMEADSDERADEGTGNGDDPPREDPPANDPPKDDTPKDDPPKDDTPKEDPKKGNKIKVGGKINAKGAKIYDYAGDKSGERQLYRNDPIYKVLEEKNGYLKVRHHKSKSGVAGWFKKKDVKAYKTGGLVDETGFAWLDGTKNKPELVLNSKDTENFVELKDALRQLSEADMLAFKDSLSMMNLLADGIKNMTNVTQLVPNTNHSQNITIQVGDIVMNGVNDVETFGENLMYHLKNNDKVTKIIQADTLGVMAGKNGLTKFKY